MVGAGVVKWLHVNVRFPLVCDNEDCEDDQRAAVSSLWFGEDSSATGEEEAVVTQVARDSTDASDDDNLFEGKELLRYDASRNAWEKYRVEYCKGENAHLVAQEAEIVAKRNKQLRDSKKAKDDSPV
ncbi:hypothetical protein PC116_g60 [Phytophthora cactorum]|uniref:Uncharacterized protein n=2 Tax=Phytophthora cactorum TaxID=29920 RepID=A0A329T6G5_9STRA|nr:hypothetical protein PC113_g309 [Phytophthora cactorum]KAG2936405.1 hypothetical protein PC114_g262 [Phytophthora cactorum]KAG2944677.1 hypothetical protein PC115_g175 [Phytophthora cactorum]KAG3041001.1 hypothetical protein PC119_g1032 [Phytophthora cactorum]KAG3193443.1 hypothetical protein C6341_g62 [Phytophthora cactorum]